jgi:hypothetical protein
MQVRRSARGGLVAAGLFALGLLFGVTGCERVEGNGLNVVLIVLDTVRADHLGLYGYHRPTSPALDRWAKEGAVFEMALATSPWTLPSFGSMYTGELPSRHSAGLVVPDPGKTRSFVALDPTAASLPEILSAKGYATAATRFSTPSSGSHAGSRRTTTPPATTRRSGART